jgi:broad specificity phosphatase PhoE
MENTFIFVNSAKSEKNDSISRLKWHLSSKGKLQAEALAKIQLLQKINLIFVSDSDRAYQTALPLAHKLKLGIERCKALNEVSMGDCPLLGKTEYEEAVEFALKNQERSRQGWETAKKAFSRFSQKIEELELAYKKKTICVITHPIVLSLYLSPLTFKKGQEYERFQKTNHAAYAIVRNRLVAKDITSR